MGQQAPLVADAFDVLARVRPPAAGSVQYTIRNRPSLLPWIEVGGGAEIVGQLAVASHGGQRGRRSPVAVAPDKAVDRRVLAEAGHSWSEHDQLASSTMPMRVR